MSALIQLPSATTVRFRNAVDRLKLHQSQCNACSIYMGTGDGDLCEKGKDIIAQELAYVQTHPLFQKERMIE